jgi:hypothetical protein
MDDNIPQFLMLEIELNFTGASSAALNRASAEALRALAGRFERGEFDDGSHAIGGPQEAAIGLIVVHYSSDDRFEGIA